MCGKKFIFSKFAGLQNYSQQIYYQMNSFTGIFQQQLKSPPPMLPPCIDLSPPSNFEELPPRAETPCFQHLWETLELQKIFLLGRFFNPISCNRVWRPKIFGFLFVFFCSTPPPSLRLECSRNRKTASFMTSHRLTKYKNLHLQSFTNGAKMW